jgi:hypothetical protein
LSNAYSHSEWEEMKNTMKVAVDQLAVCERALKWAATCEDGGTPAKTVCTPTIRDRYFEQPRLVNPAHFHNWWAQGLSKPILRLRAERELGNMGVPQYPNILNFLKTVKLSLKLTPGELGLWPLKFSLSLLKLSSPTLQWRLT